MHVIARFGVQAWQSMWDADWHPDEIAEAIGEAYQLQEALQLLRDMDVSTDTQGIQTGMVSKTPAKGDSDVSLDPYLHKRNAAYDTVYPGLRKWQNERRRQQERLERRDKARAARGGRPLVRLDLGGGNGENQEGDAAAGRPGEAAPGTPADAARTGGDAGSGNSHGGR